jgi:hypothetical protein
MRKPTMQDKFEKVQSDMNEGRYSTIEQACKANKISPASYHIYRKRFEALDNSSPVPPATNTYRPQQTRASTPTPSSGEEVNFMIGILQEKVAYLEDQNKKLMDTIVNLMSNKK